MARVIHATVLIGVAIKREASLDQSVAAATGTAARAPVASAALLYSFDYRRSGSLSFDEFLSKRLPADFAGPDSSVLDVSGWVGAIAEAAKPVAGAGAALLPQLQ